ncbi:MAG: hypothetical protein JSW61_03395 [Candidatus Thorarchaeota archaeon]|nr:MAG: hypothetical protein JSW61_03395 [Candidatus Thorarchaeota archaeon]
MNKKILSILISGIVVVSGVVVVYYFLTQGDSPSGNGAENPRVEGWMEDFNALYDFIEANYPYLWVKNRTHGYNWLDLRYSYVERIANAESDVEFVRILLDAVDALQNRHTNFINPFDYSMYRDWFENAFYPLNEIFSDPDVNATSYWSATYRTADHQKYNRRFAANIAYDKGEYVIQNTGSWTSLYGEDLRVVAVNGTPIDDVIKDTYELDYIDYDYERNKSFLWAISPRDFGQGAMFTVRNSSGHEADITFSTFSGYSGYPYSYPPAIVDTELWPDESVAYLYVSTFEWSIIQNYLGTFSDFYDQIEDYDHLIIDVRGNTGGNYQSWIEGIVEPLISEDMELQAYLAYRTDDYSNAFREGMGITTELAKESFAYLPPEAYGDEFAIYNYLHSFTPTGNWNFSGSIVVLTDHVVYSACEAFALFCKQTGFAALHGTTTGGDGLMAFPTLFKLPNSKLILNMVSALGLDITGHANEELRTRPDVLYESSLGNFSELIDYVRENLP